MQVAETPDRVTLPPPVAPSAAADPAIEAKTRGELLRMGFRELTVGTWTSVVAVVLFVVVLYGESDATSIAPKSELALFWWLGAISIPIASRFWLAFAFNRATEMSRDSRQWGLWFIAATSLSAITWGITPWLFPSLREPGLSRIVHVLLLAGLTTASGRMLLPMRKGSVLYIFAILGPLAASHLSKGDWGGIILALCVLYFAAFTAWSTLHNHRTLSNALVMRFEREALASELKEKNTRYESREVELREAREKAESASRAKGEFIATISHEIRTPMNGVLGMLRVVRDTPLSAEQRSYLKTASDSAESLLLLLNDVLDFSKIEAGRLEVEHAPFPPAAAARSVSDLMVTRARDKGLQFDLELGENLPGAIIGDGTRLRQILVNLIGNAIKFTEKGRVELAVACVERKLDRAVMHFTVTDTGIGIDSAALDRLFKPFTQADTSMSRRYGGTGLGLAISMRLAQAMGGTLQVQSTVNKGSTFRLIVPCRLPDTVEAPRATEAPKFVTPSLRGRVLVVEDDSVNKQVIELFLKKMSLSPIFAGDGEAAIATATAQEFDIVLMDCQLPGIDGMEATRRIRAMLAGKPLPIVALTANASTHVREACLAAGMDDFLSKPVRFELLAGLLARYLSPA